MSQSASVVCACGHSTSVPARTPLSDSVICEHCGSTVKCVQTQISIPPVIPKPKESILQQNIPQYAPQHTPQNTPPSTPPNTPHTPLDSAIDETVVRQATSPLAPSVAVTDNHEDSQAGGMSSRAGVIDLAQRFTPASPPENLLKDESLDSSLYGVHQILRNHAKGGMGRILVAYDRFLKREVALKELRPEVRGDISVLHRFVSESEITAQLEHPGIIPIHTLGQDDEGNPYYTMKLIRGRTLQEAIKEYHKKPDNSTLLWLIRRLVAASQPIAFAHERGVIHRDIKPANIMFGEHNETLVMDWGLAKVFSAGIKESYPESEGSSQAAQEIEAAFDGGAHITMAGTVVGTPAFMSPEQATPGSTEVGPQTDVYALGAILYAILTGKPPFVGKTGQEVLEKLRRSSPLPPIQMKKTISPDLGAICEKAMARDLKLRYATVKDFVSDLCRWLDDEPISAVKWTWSRRTVRWFKRRSVTSLLVVISIILSIFLGVYMVRERYHAQSLLAAIKAAENVEVDTPKINSRSLSHVSLVLGAVSADAPPHATLICIPPQNNEPHPSVRLDTIDAGTSSVVFTADTPDGSPWIFSRNAHICFSLLPRSGIREDARSNIESIEIRLGNGASYFRYYIPKESPLKFHENMWNDIPVPLNPTPRKPGWIREMVGNPTLDQIGWVELVINTLDAATIEIQHFTLED